jgi:dTDP-4-dehydrorhamnose 3,5-epimerase
MPTESRIPGVQLRELEVFGDARGSLAEIFRAAAMPAAFAQANHSRSAAGVLRGLHYHRRQDDLWYVVSGRARVGLADLRERRRRPAVEVHELGGEPASTLYIPRGVAHGYLALTELHLLYFVTSEYDPSDEHGVAWDDPDLAVPWDSPAGPVVSERDAANPNLEWERIPSFS